MKVVSITPKDSNTVTANFQILDTNENLFNDVRDFTLNQTVNSNGTCSFNISMGPNQLLSSPPTTQPATLSSNIYSTQPATLSSNIYSTQPATLSSNIYSTQPATLSSRCSIQNAITNYYTVYFNGNNYIMKVVSITPKDPNTVTANFQILDVNENLFNDVRDFTLNQTVNSERNM